MSFVFETFSDGGIRIGCVLDSYIIHVLDVVDLKDTLNACIGGAQDIPVRTFKMSLFSGVGRCLVQLCSHSDSLLYTSPVLMSW